MRVRITAFISDSSGKKKATCGALLATWIGIDTLWRSLLGKSSAGCLFRVCRWSLSIKKEGRIAKPRNVKTVGLFFKDGCFKFIFFILQLGRLLFKVPERHFNR